MAVQDRSAGAGLDVSDAMTEHGASLTIELLDRFQFIWGIGVGAILTLMGAVFTFYLINKRQIMLHKKLLDELLYNICFTIKEMAQYQEQTKFIYEEYLGDIASEINLYGNWRQHFVVISDDDLRWEIRRFFIRIAKYSNLARAHLQQWGIEKQHARETAREAIKEAAGSTGEVEETAAARKHKDIEARAEQEYQNAHAAYEKLVELVEDGENLRRRVLKGRRRG